MLFGNGIVTETAGHPNIKRREDELTVGNFVTVKASNFNKSQQLSTNGLQQIQYQLAGSNRFQQVSIDHGIWFGTRCSTRCSSRNSFRFSTGKFRGVEGC